VRWDDPEIGIPWPIAQPIMSPRDRALPLVRDAR
jgi:dTDP-4-dehydrorhamnose 3,5-epimerase